MKLKTLMVGIATFGLMGSVYAGGLTLHNDTTQVINSTCTNEQGQTKDGVPIPVGGQFAAPWLLIHIVYNGDKLNCNFFIDATKQPLGTATLVITPDFSTAQITSFSVQPGYDINPKNGPGFDDPASDIAITFSEKH